MKIPEAPRSANLVKLASQQPMRDPVSKNQEARTRGQTPKVDHRPTHTCIRACTCSSTHNTLTWPQLLNSSDLHVSAGITGTHLSANRLSRFLFLATFACVWSLCTWSEDNPQESFFPLTKHPQFKVLK